MILFYILILVMHLSNHPLWSRVEGDLTIFKYLGAGCGLYSIFHLCVRRKVPAFFATWQSRFFFLLYLIAATSYFTKTLSNQLGFSPLMSYTSFLLLFFITLSIVDSLARLRWVVLMAIGSVAFGSLYVIREWQKYHNLYANFRPGWVVGDSNFFATSVILCLPLAFCLMQQRRLRWERWFCLGCLVVTLVAVTLCASRGAFLGLVAAFLYFVWRSRRRVRNFVLVTILVLPFSLVLPSSPVHRFLHPSRNDKEAAGFRIVAWKAGLRMIRAHPLVGIGLGNFKPMMEFYKDPDEKVHTMAHNIYIEIAAEMGLPALLTYLAMMYFSYRTLEQVRRRSLRSGPPLLHQAALGIQAGLVGYAVGAFVLSAQYQKLFWLVVFLSMCLSSLARSLKSQDDRREEKGGPMVNFESAAKLAREDAFVSW